MPQSCVSNLSTGHVIGLAFCAQASAISFLSVVTLVVIILIKYRHNYISPPNGPWRLLRSNLDAYMLNLLFADIILSVSGFIDVKWVIEKRSYCGSICSAQGALTIIGTTATAFFTTAIAIHTWISIYKNQRTGYSLPIWLVFSATVWSFVLLFVVAEWTTHRKAGLPGDGSSFYRPAPFWCWISSDYLGARVGGEYLWVWICGFGNIALYGPLFLFSRGNLVFRARDGKVHWEWHFPACALSRAPTPTNSHDSLGVNAHDDILEQQALRSQAWTMLLYPFAYTIQVLPLSIVRWTTFIAQPHGLSLANDPTLGGFAATHLLFRFIFRLSGFVNVLLILVTRPNVLLFGSRGVLAPNDPRVKAEAQQCPDVEQDEKSEVHLPQVDGIGNGGTSQVWVPEIRVNNS